MVEVVKFRHGGKSGLQHLDIELGRNSRQIIRRQTLGQTVHRLAPVQKAVPSGTRGFGQSGHRPLERVTVAIRHTGHADSTTKIDSRTV